MEATWLYALCECVFCLSVVVMSARLCLSTTIPVGGGDGAGGGVTSCLKLCLGWVGAVGGAVGVPVSVLLNLRSPRCLYTCITLVCCPLLVRQFTMFLLLLLTLDTHLQHRSQDRYHRVVTCRRALCVVMLCWVVSVLASFAQFIGWDVLDTWSVSGEGGTAGLGLGDVNKTSLPKYPQDRSEIGRFLPYGGFLSKFYTEDLHNFTYAEIHGSHWGVCAPDTVLRPQYQVYIYGVTVFLVPLLVLLVLYLDVVCAKPRQSFIWVAEPPKRRSLHARSLALSLCLLVFLCLPLHVAHCLLLFSPDTVPPSWAHPLAAILFQGYGVVPPLLFTPAPQEEEDERVPLPHLVPVPSRGEAMRRALCEGVQAATCSRPRCSDTGKRSSDA